LVTQVFSEVIKVQSKPK